MGCTYVKIAANSVNGSINNLNTSGGDRSGWLYWNQYGFTGVPWSNYWSNSYGLDTAWTTYLNSGEITCNVSHTADAAGLQEHIAGGHADDLNDLISLWGQGKYTFIGNTSYYSEFVEKGCLIE